MADDRSLGEIMHEAREAGNAVRIRPLAPQDWADRDPRLRDLDEQMAAAVDRSDREHFRVDPGRGGRAPAATRGDVAARSDQKSSVEESLE